MFGETLPLMKAMEQKMHWLTDRQQVLAQNIANADTPGYKPRDLTSFEAQLTSAGGASLAVVKTNSKHIAPGGTLSSSAKIIMDKVASNAGSENGVVVEDQIKKSTETVMDYQLMSNLYRKQATLLKMAVGARA